MLTNIAHISTYTLFRFVVHKIIIHHVETLRNYNFVM